MARELVRLFGWVVCGVGVFGVICNIVIQGYVYE